MFCAIFKEVEGQGKIAWVSGVDETLVIRIGDVLYDGGSLVYLEGDLSNSSGYQAFHFLAKDANHRDHEFAIRRFREHDCCAHLPTTVFPLFNCCTIYVMRTLLVVSKRGAPADMDRVCAH